MFVPPGHEQVGKPVVPSRAPASSAHEDEGTAVHVAAPAHNPVWQSLATRLQPKLSVNQPGDSYEQEADRVADQVLSMPESATAAPEPLEHRQVEAPGGGGRPLPGSVRTFFEPRFGRDLSAVRVHTGTRASELAQNLNAKAFTVGHDIVFGAGQFAPTATEGKRLLGHELTHVMQQAPADRQSPVEGAAAQPVRQAHPGAVLQRQPAGPEGEEENPPAATGPAIQFISGVGDMKTADAAIRDFFGSGLIKGAGVQPSQFKVAEEEKFGKAIPNSKQAIPQLLLGMFLNPDADTTGILNQMLRYHGVAMAVHRDPVKKLKAFIEERIKEGYFAYATAIISDKDTTNVIKVTPEDLVAMHIKGITATGPQQRALRQIVVQPGEMSTLVHEVIHFYTHPTYQAEVARLAGEKHFMGVLLSEALIEGVTEHFAKEVMRARQKQLGAMGSEAYSSYVEAVELLAEVTGEHTLRLAYFQGDKQAIARLFKNIEIFTRLLDEGDFSPEKIVEIHHLHEPLEASWFSGR